MLTKIILYFSLMIIFINARGIETDIGIDIGLNSTKNEDKNKFENPTIGLRYQVNKYIVNPRIDLEYVKVQDDIANSLLKASVNAVYEYENKTNTTPYVLTGLGYEYVSSGTKDRFESHPFVQAGAGLNFELNQGYKAHIEAKALQIIGGNDENNELMLTAGVSMPLKSLFSQNRTSYVKPIQRFSLPIAPVIEPIIVPQPKIIIVNSNNNECPIKINAADFDRDGIRDDRDQCPNTPCSFSVDTYGCPIKTTLRVNFATNSANIKESSLFKIKKFADFLLKNKGSFLTITGHTDSIGSLKQNLNLSKKRANSVLKILVQEGVSLGRLSAIGMGESMPVASNLTILGQASNRRIEVELRYAKGER